MGLDMNLYRKSYVKNWEHQPKEVLHEITVKQGGVDRPDIKPERIAYVVEDIAYWRKANAIHNWIIKNCANGDENASEVDMDIKDFKKLLLVVNTVLANSKQVEGKIGNGQTLKNGKWEKVLVDGKKVEDSGTAEMLLPTANGFFFGSTDYDEYYIKDLEYTKSVLEPIVANEANDKAYYFYQASW